MGEFSERIRRAAALDPEPEPEQITAATPLAELKRLATEGRNETVRMQAARYLQQREDEARERRRRPEDVLSPERLEIVRQIWALSPADLAEALVDFFTPLQPCPPSVPKIMSMDAVALEAEVNRRAEEKAQALYVARGLQQAEAAANASEPSSAAPESPAPTEPDPAPERRESGQEDAQAKPPPVPLDEVGLHADDVAAFERRVRREQQGLDPFG